MTAEITTSVNSAMFSSAQEEGAEVQRAGCRPPPRFVDTIELELKTDLLSTFWKVSYDAKSKTRRQNPTGSLREHLFLTPKISAGSPHAGGAADSQKFLSS